MYTPEHLQLWKHPECYLGATWYEYFVVFGMHRDSPLLTKHNFEVIKSTIESKLAELKVTHINEGADDEEPILVNPYESHWAVGHVEWIGLHKNAPEELLKLADDLLKQIEDYPVLNEDEFSTKEWDAANKLWASLPLKERIELCRKNHHSIFAARSETIPQCDDNGAIFDYCRPD